MEGYSIEVSFSNGQKYFFERVTMRKGEKILVVDKFGGKFKKVYRSKRDLFNRMRYLRSQFGDIATFEAVPSCGREVQKLL